MIEQLAGLAYVAMLVSRARRPDGHAPEGLSRARSSPRYAAMEDCFICRKHGAMSIVPGGVIAEDEHALVSTCR